MPSNNSWISKIKETKKNTKNFNLGWIGKVFTNKKGNQIISFPVLVYELNLHR
jgi:hypothetical protein